MDRIISLLPLFSFIALPFMSTTPMCACFQCFNLKQECHWIALNSNYAECVLSSNDNCSYWWDPSISATHADGSTSCEILFIIPGPLAFTLLLDLKNLLRTLIALRAESLQSDVGNQDEYINCNWDKQITDIYQLLGEDLSGDPSIPPLNSIISVPNTLPTSNPSAESERLAMLLSLLDSTHSSSTASSRDVRSIADLTDAEFKELKSISMAQNIVFEDIIGH